MLPREIVATTIDGTFEFGGMLSPKSAGLESVWGGNLGLWMLAEDFPYVTFVNRMARAGHLNPMLAHRGRTALAPSQVEIECSLCREGTWNRVRAGMLKWSVAVMGY